MLHVRPFSKLGLALSEHALAAEPLCMCRMLRLLLNRSGALCALCAPLALPRCMSVGLRRSPLYVEGGRKCLLTVLLPAPWRCEMLLCISKPRGWPAASLPLVSGDVSLRSPSVVCRWWAPFLLTTSKPALLSPMDLHEVRRLSK